MTRLERPACRALAIVLGSAAALALAAPGAGADQIARPPGAVDHRGYELVSQADKGSSQIHSVNLPLNGGDRALYDLVGGAPGSQSGFAAMFLATRTAGGWVSTTYLPPRAQMLHHNYVVGASTPDLSASIVSSMDSIGSSADSAGVALARLTSSGVQTFLHAFPVYFGPFGISLVASDDLQHVLADVPEPIDPSHQPGTFNVYDFGSGSPVLVSSMPGTGLAPLCGLSVGSGFSSFADDNSSRIQHWVSTDGSRAFFVTQGDDCGGPNELYMRDLNAQTTTLISGPPVGGDPDNGVDVFLGATPDGSQVFFRTATSLDPADDVDGNSSDMDVYRWTTATNKVSCLTCSVPNADVSTASSPDTNALVSEDGSHVYFTSPNQFGDAPSAGSSDAPNLYEWRLHHTLLHFIARVNGIDPIPANGGQTTPDGKFLIFTSNQPGLDAISDGSNGGFMQYYRYDDVDGSVTCVSCPSGGAATSDVPTSLENADPTVQPHLRIVTDDGGMVFFPTSEALVPEDVNDGPDIYEWHDGTVKLITDGVTSYTPGSEANRLVGASPDGHDVFFLDTAQLTFDALDRLSKIYDARVDGGFEPPPPPPTPCDGDACQGGASGPPTLPDPGSSSLNDPGNVVPGRFSVAHITSAQRSRLAGGGALTVSVRVNMAGRVSVLGQAAIGRRTERVARASATALRAGVVKLTLRLSRAARRQLARTGRLRLVLVVGFSKAPASQRVALSLRAPKARSARVRATANGR